MLHARQAQHTVHSAGAGARCKVQSASALARAAECLMWAAGVRSDVHQLALPRPDKWGFSGQASANTPLTSSDRNLIAGYHGVGYHISAQRGRGPGGFALHLQFGIWRANERRRVPELTITQAPEPVEASHSSLPGQYIHYTPIPTTLSRMLDGLAGQRSEQRVRDTSNK